MRTFLKRLVSLVVLLFLAVTVHFQSAALAEPSASQSQEIWGCSAVGGTHRYVVDQLASNGKSFDIAIYQGSGDKYSDYIGTVQANRIQDETYSAQSYNSTLNILALGRTPAFIVTDSVDGQASGRCWVQWELADSKTRRLVRQCLALAERKYGSLPEVVRNGCIGNPSDYMAQEQLPSSALN